MLLLFFYAYLPVRQQKNGFPPLRPKKTMLNQLLKNRIICRIIDLSCRIISLENATEFPIFCRTLSEALPFVHLGGVKVKCLL